MSDLRHDATVQRTALLLGLRTGEQVAAWCEEQLQALDVPPAELIELALIRPSDLSALRIALQPLSIEPEPPEVVQEMLRLTATDLLDGRRDVPATVRVLAQMRRMLPLGEVLAHDFDLLEDSHMLAVAGVQGDLPTVEAEVRRYLSACASPTSISNPTPVNG